MRIRRTHFQGLWGVAVAAAVVAMTPPTAQAQSIVPCLNYEVRTEWGRLTVDTRPAGTDRIGVISIALFLNNVAHAPGIYTWQAYVNGRLMRRGADPKDDNFHTAIRHIINENGRTTINYAAGDIFHINITHPVDGGRITYVTPENQCVIASH